MDSTSGTYNEAAPDFEKLFRRYYRALAYFARTILEDPDLAEDVVQNVFTGLLDSRRAFESEEHARHFLYRAVKNACLNELRNSMIKADLLEKYHSDAGEEAEWSEDPEIFTRLVKTEIYRQILDAVETLPAECARIFRMSYFEHLDNQEIADLLSLSVNTVKVQKNNAKKRLRLLLKDLYPLVFLIP